MYVVKHTDLNDKVVVFLHGASYSSAVWQKLGTFSALDTAGEFPCHSDLFLFALLQSPTSLISNSGYTGLAVDLPGYGRSVGQVLPSQLRPSFLQWLLKNFEVERASFVCPSVSAQYCLQFAAEYPELVTSLVLVGPSATLSPTILEKISSPTLFIYGEKDDKGKRTSLAFQSKIKNSRNLGIAKGNHACYLDDPVAFHTGVINFLNEAYLSQF